MKVISTTQPLPEHFLVCVDLSAAELASRVSTVCYDSEDDMSPIHWQIFEDDAGRQFSLVERFGIGSYNDQTSTISAMKGDDLQGSLLSVVSAFKIAAGQVRAVRPGLAFPQP